MSFRIDLVYELLSAMDKLESDDIRNLALNSDLDKICQILQKHGVCKKEKEEKHGTDKKS